MDEVLERYSEQMQGLEGQIYRNMASAMSCGLSDDVDHYLIFEGFKAYLDKRGKFQVDEGNWEWTTSPKDMRLTVLANELNEAIAAVTEYREDMKDVIAFAGDISDEEIEDLRALIDKQTRRFQACTQSSPTSASELNQLARLHGFDLAVTLTPDSYQSTSDGLVKSFSAFSVSMTNTSEQELETKILLQFNKQLLKLYKYRFVKQVTSGTIFKFASKAAVLGVPHIVIRSECREQGYYRDIDGKHVLEEYTVTYSNGCIFTGRKVNNRVMGKGSFRMTGGELFRGEVVSNTLAKGEIIDGNISKKSEFHLEEKDNTVYYTAFGHVEIFNKGVKFEDVVIAEDGSEQGWHKSGNTKRTGRWERNGDFTGVVEDNKVRSEGFFGPKGLEGKGKYTEGNYCYDGYFVHGKSHGKGTSTNGSQRIIGEWQENELVSGILIDGTIRYEGSFNGGKYHGYGKLEQPNLFYAGNFSQGKFEGQGTYRSQGFQIIGDFHDDQPHGHCTYTKDSVTYVGNYWRGKWHGKGRLVCPSHTYSGDFDSGDMHGMGEYKTEKWTYTGQLNRGKFEGSGTWVQSEYTYTGSFSNDKFNGYGTVRWSSGVSKSGFFKDDQMT